MENKEKAGIEIKITEQGLKELDQIDREYGLDLISKKIVSSVDPMLMDEIENLRSCSGQKNTNSKLY